MHGTYLTTLLQIRLLIGFLGEKANFGWWPTAFFEPSSRLFLEPVFTKTHRLAQYHGLLEAARRVHDERLSVGTYHVFRLPEEVEQDLHAVVQSNLGEELFRELTQSKELALDMLQRLAPSVGTFNEGPVSVGNIKSLDAPETLKAIAAAYFAAFSQNAKSYPYLVM